MTSTIAFFLVAGAFGQTHGLGTGLRSYVGGPNPNPDEHQVLSSNGVGPLLGHTDASITDLGGSRSSSADASADYGNLGVDLMAASSNNPGWFVYGVATNFGGPNASYYDRIYVQGAAPGQSVTISVTALLTNVNKVYGNNNNALNTMQGLDGSLNIYQLGGASHFLHVVSRRDGAIYQDDLYETLNFTATVGSYFDISGGLFAESSAYDSSGPTTINSTGSVSGRFLTGLTSQPGINLVGTSGHVYQAVPEPGTLAALGIGGLGLVRRRKK